MLSNNFLLALLPLLQLANADRLGPRQAFDPFHSCSDCFRSSWTQGPECRTNTILLSTISRILNPPSVATPTYAPSQWCSDYLRQTDIVTFGVNITAISTSTNVEFYQPIVTKTDLSHPTLTALCPVPSTGMECGWDTNTISPAEQGLDESVLNDGIGSAEECHQACLLRPACKAYRWDGRIGNPCAIFNVGIGPNAANLINPTPGGTQWYDRNCPVDLPAGCTLGRYPYSNATAVPPPVIASAAPPALPSITPAPVATPGVVPAVSSLPRIALEDVQGLPPLAVVPRPPSLPPPVVTNPGNFTPPIIPNPPNLLPPVVPSPPNLPPPPPPGLPSPPIQPDFPEIPIEPNGQSPPGPPGLPIPQSPPRPTPRALAKRSIPFPPYFADLNYIWSSVWVTPACSCIISSALPPVPSRTTRTITRHNATVVITTTTVDPFTITITPREVTMYVSIA
ncbi:hypothetical protein PMIN02_009191 [Paraphaeosphaeria minitans]